MVPGQSGCGVRHHSVEVPQIFQNTSTVTVARRDFNESLLLVTQPVRQIKIPPTRIPGYGTKILCRTNKPNRWFRVGRAVDPAPVGKVHYRFPKMRPRLCSRGRISINYYCRCHVLYDKIEPSRHGFLITLPTFNIKLINPTSSSVSGEPWGQSETTQ